jgi:AcrR family transcriptional regulator
MEPGVDDKSVRPARGRPRTAGLEERVLAATRRVVAARGYDATTLDDIAADAAVSKGSIYRRWSSKGVLVYEACIASGDDLPQVIDTGDIRADLVAIAMLTVESFRTGAQALFTKIAAEAQRDPVLTDLLRTRFFQPRSDAIVRRVERAVERGELTAGIEVELVPAVLNGSQQYMWAVRERTLTDPEVDALVDSIIGPFLPPEHFVSSR